MSFANNEVIFKNKVLDRDMAVTLGWQRMSSEKFVGEYHNGKEVLKVPNRISVRVSTSV